MNFNFYLTNIVVNIFILIKSLISKLTGVRGELLYDLIHGSCNLKGFEVHYWISHHDDFEEVVISHLGDLEWVKVFGVGIELGGLWLRAGIEPINPLDLPLFNRVILLSSGGTATYSHHSLIASNRKGALYGLIAAVILAVLQAIEYSLSSFTISDGIFGTCFYFSTGSKAGVAYFYIFFNINIFIISVYINFDTKNHLVNIKDYNDNTILLSNKNCNNKNFMYVLNKIIYPYENCSPFFCLGNPVTRFVILSRSIRPYFFLIKGGGGFYPQDGVLLDLIQRKPD